MIVYVNANNEIKAVNTSSDASLTALTINDDANPFNGWSTAKICCYKVTVQDGFVTMMTPYIDSRFLDNFDQLGLSTEVNTKDISDTQMGLAETYETTYTSISNVELALTEVYEMIINSQEVSNG